MLKCISKHKEMFLMFKQLPFKCNVIYSKKFSFQFILSLILETIFFQFQMIEKIFKFSLNFPFWTFFKLLYLLKLLYETEVLRKLRKYSRKPIGYFGTSSSCFTQVAFFNWKDTIKDTILKYLFNFVCHYLNYLKTGFNNQFLL